MKTMDAKIQELMWDMSVVVWSITYTPVYFSFDFLNIGMTKAVFLSLQLPPTVKALKCLDIS